MTSEQCTGQYRSDDKHKNVNGGEQNEAHGIFGNRCSGDHPVGGGGSVTGGHWRIWLKIEKHNPTVAILARTRVGRRGFQALGRRRACGGTRAP